MTTGVEARIHTHARTHTTHKYTHTHTRIHTVYTHRIHSAAVHFICLLTELLRGGYNWLQNELAHTDTRQLCTQRYTHIHTH